MYYRSGKQGRNLCGKKDLTTVSRTLTVYRMAATTGRPVKSSAGANALWNWLEKRGLNQREAAEILNIHWVSLNQILMDRRRPGLAIALRISQAAGIEPGIWTRTQVRQTSQVVSLVGRKR